jgi:hypothetical protein
LSHALDGGVTIVADGVASEPQLVPLVKEYNKYLLRRASAVLGI